mgnify:CR=1 FL=1
MSRSVATRTGGLVDSVIDGETGVLVQPRDPADFARGIVSLLRDREAARALGERGRALMLEKFTLRKTAEDLHALYQALLFNQDCFDEFKRLLVLYEVDVEEPEDEPADSFAGAFGAVEDFVRGGHRGRVV